MFTNKQIVEDLIEWLKPLKDKMLSQMPHWKPSCFSCWWCTSKIKGIRSILYLVPTLCLFLYMFLNIFHKIIDYYKYLCCTNPIRSWRFYCICVFFKAIWGMDEVPIYLCCWHVLKAWCLRDTEKIEDCGSAGWNPSRPSWCDVHVHQSWRNNWWLQRAWEACFEIKLS